jgi:hypothetical protein
LLLLAKTGNRLKVVLGAHFRNPCGLLRNEVGIFFSYEKFFFNVLESLRVRNILSLDFIDRFVKSISILLKIYIIEAETIPPSIPPL